VALFELQMSAQELFERVANHLLNQGSRSADSGDYCLYRGPAGMMCAAGILIPDEAYKPEMEQKAWCKLVSNFDFPTEHKDLIIDLQIIHDDYPPENWRVQLIQCGKRHNLNTEFLVE
jgi:hypothetical protein